jgi:hypothetical protein
MRLWLYGKLLNSMLKTNRYNKFYLKVWELWHIEKRRVDMRNRDNSMNDIRL